MWVWLLDYIQAIYSVVCSAGELENDAIYEERKNIDELDTDNTTNCSDDN